MTRPARNARASATSPFDTLLQDVRYAARRLRSNWGFTFLVVLTLTLGIGATTSVFSVINGVLLRPLPYPESGRLVAIAERNKSGAVMNVADPNFIDLQEQNRSLDALAYYSSAPTTVLGGTDPVLANVADVSTDFFKVIGVAPSAGRVFTRDETMAGGVPTAVVSYRFWRDQLGAASDFSTRTLTIEGKTMQVVGVMPQGFDFPEASDVWMPMPLDGTSRTAHNLELVGRLRAGISVSSARTDIGVIYFRLKATYGEAMDATAFDVRTLQEKIVGSVQRPLILLLGAAAFVLLIACTNVASTLLAAAARRRGEMALRAALGATRNRMLRQLTTEGVLLSLFGAAGGLAVAAAMLRALLLLAPAASLPRASEIRLDGTVVAFAVAVGVLAAIASSLFPALRASSASIGREMGARGQMSSGGTIWSALVATEVALAILLLLGSTLVARSFAKVLSIDPGFKSEGVLTVEIAVPGSIYPNEVSLSNFFARVIPAVAAIPGVEHAGASTSLPFNGFIGNGGISIEGHAPGDGYGDYAVATRGYFEAFEIPLERGRIFDDRDRAGAPDAAVVNQALANTYWSGEDPIGKRIHDLTFDNYGSARWLTVVGVVGDVRNRSLTTPASPLVYVNPQQRPQRSRYAYLTIRSALAPAALQHSVQAVLRQIAPGVPAKYETMDALMASSIAGRLLSSSVLGVFAAVALILAAIGIYGVVSYQVVQRTREMGVRMALGARPGQVRGMVVGGSMRVVGVGLFAGAVAFPLLTRAIQSLLYGVEAIDPGTITGVLLLFGTVAAMASLIPAHRATRVDPLVALRSE